MTHYFLRSMELLEERVYTSIPRITIDFEDNGFRLQRVALDESYRNQVVAPWGRTYVFSKHDNEREAIEAFLETDLRFRQGYHLRVRGRKAELFIPRKE